MNFFKTIAHVIKGLLLFFATAGAVWYLLGQVNDRNPMDDGMFVDQKIERMVNL